MLYRVIGTVIGTLIEVRVLIPRYNNYLLGPPTLQEPPFHSPGVTCLEHPKNI